jgi:valyl-tRNA synthetase
LGFDSSSFKVFIQVQSDQEAALFSPQCSTIVALTKGCKSAKVVRDQTDIPEGCGSAVVTPTILVHTLVRVSAIFFISWILFY